MPHPAAVPPVVLLTGAPGAGKSTVGRALAQRLGAALVDQDTATAPLVAVVATLLGLDGSEMDDLDDPRLARATRRARYETIIALAEDNLRVGTPVVVVAPFTEERRSAGAWDVLDCRLRAAGGSPLLVWLRLAPESIVERLRARGAARDLAKLADPAAFLAGWDVTEPVVPHLSVTGDGATDIAVREVLAALAKPPI